MLVDFQTFNQFRWHHNLLGSMRYMMRETVKCPLPVKGLSIYTPALIISTDLVWPTDNITQWEHAFLPMWVLLHTDKRLNGILCLTLHCKCIYHRSAASCRNKAMQPTFQNVKQADSYTLFISALIFLPVFFPTVEAHIFLIRGWYFETDRGIEAWKFFHRAEQSCGQK